MLNFLPLFPIRSIASLLLVVLVTLLTEDRGRFCAYIIRKDILLVRSKMKFYCLIAGNTWTEKNMYGVTMRPEV